MQSFKIKSESKYRDHMSNHKQQKIYHIWSSKSRAFMF